MTEQNDNKINKLDIISALQMKNAHESEKKNEEEDIDDGWSDYSDEEDVGNKPIQNQNTNKNDSSSRMVAKADVKSKKFTNLKDYLGTEAGNNQNKFSHGQNNNYHHKKKQGGNFYKEGNRDNKKDYSNKPVFINAHKDNIGIETPSNSEFDNIINNNAEYSQRNYQTGHHYGNTNKRYHNNYRNQNNHYNSHRNQHHNRPDPKQDVLDTIKNFGKVLGEINEENKNLKDSTRGYMTNTSENTTHTYRDNREHKPVAKNDFSRPTFINSSLLENKVTNFKELEPSADPFIRKLQEKNEETQYYQNQKRNLKTHYNQKEKEHEEHQEIMEHTEEVQQEPKSERNETTNHSKYNKYSKKYVNNNNFFPEDEIWNQVVTSNNNDVNKENPNHDEIETQDQQEKTNDWNKTDNDYNKSKTRPSKRNSNLKNVEDEKKKSLIKDKVVLSTGNFKSIKDIFG